MVRAAKETPIQAGNSLNLNKFLKKILNQQRTNFSFFGGDNLTIVEKKLEIRIIFAERVGFE